MGFTIFSLAFAFCSVQYSEVSKPADRGRGTGRLLCGGYAHLRYVFAPTWKHEACNRTSPCNLQFEIQMKVLVF